MVSEGAVTKFSWTLEMLEAIYERRIAENAGCPEMKAYYYGKVDALKKLEQEFNEAFGISEEAEEAAC